MSQKRKSKYLGMTIDGWKVVSRDIRNYDTCEGTHATFTLKKKQGLSVYTMTLSDREMTQITKHGKDINETIKGKQSDICLKHLHRVAQNTIYKTTSIANLFKAI